MLRITWGDRMRKYGPLILGAGLVALVLLLLWLLHP